MSILYCTSCLFKYVLFVNFNRDALMFRVCDYKNQIFVSEWCCKKIEKQKKNSGFFFFDQKDFFLSEGFFLERRKRRTWSFNVEACAFTFASVIPKTSVSTQAVFRCDACTCSCFLILYIFHPMDCADVWRVRSFQRVVMNSFNFLAMTSLVRIEHMWCLRNHSQLCEHQDR